MDTNYSALYVFIILSYIVLLDDALEKFLIEVNNAAHKGVTSTGNVTMSEPNWSFGQSIFFSVTVLTTIGNICRIWGCGMMVYETAIHDVNYKLLQVAIKPPIMDKYIHIRMQSVKAPN